MYHFPGENGLLRHFLAAQYSHQRKDQVLAQCFQFVVDAGHLRLAAMRQQGIVVAYDTQLPRYGKPRVPGETDGAYSQAVVGGDDAVELQPFLMEFHQVLRHGVDILMRSLVELDQVVASKQFLGFHGTAVARHLFFAAVGGGIGKIQNVLHTGLDQLQSGLINGGKIVRQDAVYIGRFQCGVQQHYRHLGGGVQDVAVLGVFAVNKIGTHQDNAVHFLGNQQVHTAFFILQVIAGAAKDAVVAVAPQFLLNIVDGLGQIQVRGIGAHDADGFHGVETQAPGKRVGGVFALVNDVQHLLLGLFADIAAAVEHSGYSGDGDACFFGDIIYCHVSIPVMVKR